MCAQHLLEQMNDANTRESATDREVDRRARLYEQWSARMPLQQFALAFEVRGRRRAAGELPAQARVGQQFVPRLGAPVRVEIGVRRNLVWTLPGGNIGDMSKHADGVPIARFAWNPGKLTRLLQSTRKRCHAYRQLRATRWRARRTRRARAHERRVDFCRRWRRCLRAVQGAAGRSVPH